MAPGHSAGSVDSLDVQKTANTPIVKAGRTLKYSKSASANLGHAFKSSRVRLRGRSLSSSMTHTLAGLQGALLDRMSLGSCLTSRGETLHTAAAVQVEAQVNSAIPCALENVYISFSGSSASSRLASGQRSAILSSTHGAAQTLPNTEENIQAL